MATATPPRSARHRPAAHPHAPDHRWRRRARRAYALALTVAVGLAVLAGDPPAAAGTGTPVRAGDGSQQLGQVIDNARLWVLSLLAGLATLVLVVAGVRYVTSGGDPGEVQKAKTILKSAAIGYALAILAPILMTALKSIVGG